MTFFNSREELMAFMQEQAAKQEMAQDDYRHGVQRMFDELTEEQLVSLRHMLHNIAMSSESQLASYYEGQTSQALYHKFNICPGCGVDHEKELLTPPEDIAEKKEENVMAPMDLSDELLVEVEDAHTEYPKIGVATQTYVQTWLDEQGQRETMERLGLDDAYDEETKKFLGFICLNCQMIHPSIQSRLNHGEDKNDCAGCIRKVKWG